MQGEGGMLLGAPASCAENFWVTPVSIEHLKCVCPPQLYRIGCCDWQGFKTKMPSVRVTEGLLHKASRAFVPIFDIIYPHFSLLLRKEKFQWQWVVALQFTLQFRNGEMKSVLACLDSRELFFPSPALCQLGWQQSRDVLVQSLLFRRRLAFKFLSISTKQAWFL